MGMMIVVPASLDFLWGCLNELKYVKNIEQGWLVVNTVKSLAIIFFIIKVLLKLLLSFVLLVRQCNTLLPRQLEMFWVLEYCSHVTLHTYQSRERLSSFVQLLTQVQKERSPWGWIKSSEGGVGGLTHREPSILGPVSFPFFQCSNYYTTLDYIAGVANVNFLKKNLKKHWMKTNASNWQAGLTWHLCGQISFSLWVLVFSSIPGDFRISKSW